MSSETVPDEYGQDYYETYGRKYYESGLGPIPYERSEHWVNFFAIISDQLIRSLEPHRVLDAGCAMGFLVEAFWDRGVHCEGIDLSEYAISNVRPDIREYCSVRSLTDPITGKYDVVTCIEVLEHLPPELARPAIANLCSASDTVLFSSTPSDFDEATHQNVRPSIYWLKLFSEFDFWPDARFDCSFITPHAMLLKKGPPPPDDYLRLFSEYIRYKIALEAITATKHANEKKFNELRAVHDRLALALQTSYTQLFGVERSLDSQRSQESEPEKQLAQLSEQAQSAKLRLTLSISEKDHLKAEVEQLRIAVADRERLVSQIQTLSSEVQRLDTERAAIGTTLHQVLTSRAWRVAEKCRKPLRKLKTKWPRTFKLLKALARRTRSAGKSNPLPDTTRPAERSSRAFMVGASSSEVSDSGWTYQRWINEREPGSEQLRVQRESAKSLNGPLFSIIVPVHQTDYSMLQACVQSVLEQTYSCWQLCAAITPGGDPRNIQYLNELAKTDKRLRVIELSENLGISGNSNAALDLAKGEFIVLLDHDDTLAPFALFEVFTRLSSQPDADLIYSDHDYFDPEGGLRRDPLFKPDWSPAIMFSANYITHLTVLRKTLVDQVGRFDSATDGAQDWDLFLRATEQTSRISHIPKVLYHWRMHAGSTARNDSAKNYAADAQLLALRRHMERIGMEAQPEVMPDGLLHVRFAHTPTGKISIIVPTKDRVDLLSRCISSLLKITSHDNFEILIVDTGSIEPATKEYFLALEKESRVRVLWHPGPFNYSSVNNRAARESQGEFLLFLNNDVEITKPDWLSELVSWANQTSIGIVGARLLRENGTIQHAGIVLGMSGFAGHPFADSPALTFNMAGSTGWYRDFLAVTGACMMMRRKVFDELNGFDENFIICGSDVEICLRATAKGYQVVYNPFAELIHYEQQTRGNDVPSEDFVESLKHYRRWLLSGDPYWNPNLSLWQQPPAFRYATEQSSIDFAEQHTKSVQTAQAAPVAKPVSEEDRMVGWFDCSEEQFQQLHEQALTSAALGNRAAKRVLWFIPPFQYPFYGGAHTILRFADSWARDHGVTSLFAVCGSVDHNAMVDRIRKVYPMMDTANLFVLDSIARATELPAADATICTLWTTAYYALMHQNAARRFYLIQDYEPAFYRAGSASALVESTYRMGLYGIANTISLKKMYESEYNGKAVHFRQCIVDSVFFASERAPEKDRTKPWQVVCYGRPDNPRNAFEIVKKAMRLLKDRLGDRVRIVSAGEAWKPSEYGLQGIVENLGVLPYEDSARLYRESDLGVVMMLTRHPSYIPLEMMASGCLAVTNINSWTSWMLQHEENCLLAHATATSIADAVERGLLDTGLRESIRNKALAFVRSDYLNWSAQASKIYYYLCDPEASIVQDVDIESPHKRQIVAAVRPSRPLSMAATAPAPASVPALVRTPAATPIVTPAAIAPPVPTEETVPVDGYLVPARLARLTGCSAETFEAYGASQFRGLQRYLNIESNDSVLEIGCGVGRLAIPATHVIGPAGSYLGIDIIQDSIDWCSANITRRLPQFRFHFENVNSQIHNPSGYKDPATTKIPLPNASVDKIFLSSVFTHMFPEGVHNYLAEFRRVLKPSGIVLSTMFLLNPGSRAAIQRGATPWKFSYEYAHSGCCFIDSLEYPEGAVAYDENGYLEMVRSHDIDLVHPLVYGSWSGQGGSDADGQDYVIYGPKKV